MRYIKKSIIFLLVCLLMFCFTACGGEENKNERIEGEVLSLPERNDYSEYDFPDYSKMKSFCNTEQYANMQSYCGWYYCYGSTSDSELEYMTYDPYSGSYRGGSSLIMYIQKDEWQPSNEYDMACCFKTPRAGEITIDLSLFLIYTQDVSDDGVSFYCLTSFNSKKSFFSAYLRGSENTAEDSVKITVKKGEILYFVMSANEGRYNDLTRVNIKINY